MATPRIAPGGFRELGPVNYALCRVAGRVVGGPPPHVFTTLGRQRGLFRAWLWFSGRLMPGGRLPRRDTELVILRVATLRACDYELNHHRRIGRRVGLSTDEVGHVDDATWSGYSDRQRLLLEAATQLVETDDLDDALWARVRSQLDEPTTIELVMLVGQYDSLATTLMTLRVQPEDRASSSSAFR